MSAVDPTLFGYSSPDPTATTGEDDLLDKDVFMMLLLEQMQNQDPLDPMSSDDMTQQLASLTTVEELQKVNENMATMHTYQLSQTNLQAVSMIGKEVKAVGTSLVVDSEGDVPVNFFLGDNAATLKISITDEDGNLVRTLELDDYQAGSNVVQWDGNDELGERVDSGAYEFTIEAATEDGAEVQVDTFIEGIVTTIKYEGGIPVLVVDGHDLLMSDIYEINTVNEEGEESET